VSKTPEHRPKVAGDDVPENTDPHILEELFPEPDKLFQPYVLPSIREQSVGVAIDASAMLLRG
jgi:hypothetical protein